MKIDMFNHIFPKAFFDRHIAAGRGGRDIGKRVANIQTIVDVDARLKLLDQFGDYVQVISLPLPPLEVIAGPDRSPQLAAEANDGLAALVQKHDRFLGFAAALPMNNPEAAVQEMSRAVHGWDQLGTRTSDVDYTSLLKSMPKRPVDYFKEFYADTALFGAASATRCGLDFFGLDRVVFASDMPFEPTPGLYARETIACVEALELSAPQKDRIYRGNAERLLNLNPVSAPAV